MARPDCAAALVRELRPFDRAPVAARLTLLRKWEKKTRKFLPLVLKIMGS